MQVNLWVLLVEELESTTEWILYHTLHVEIYILK